MPKARKIEVKKLDPDLKSEQVGQIVRKVLFSPQTTGNSNLKMAYLEVPSGAQGTPHVHLGEEVVYTISGTARMMVDGEEVLLEPGTFTLIPPDLPHPAKVISSEPWVAVAAYCDECPVLKKARGKQEVDYPLDV